MSARTPVAGDGLCLTGGVPRNRLSIDRLGEHKDALACVTVRDCTGINPATLSHHMKELELAGLVEVARDGKFASYSLRRDVLEAFFQRLRDDLA